MGGLVPTLPSLQHSSSCDTDTSHSLPWGGHGDRAQPLPGPGEQSPPGDMSTSPPMVTHHPQTPAAAGAPAPLIQLLSSPPVSFWGARGVHNPYQSQQLCSEWQQAGGTAALPDPGLPGASVSPAAQHIPARPRGEPGSPRQQHRQQGGAWPPPAAPQPRRERHNCHLANELWEEPQPCPHSPVRHTGPKPSARSHPDPVPPAGTCAAGGDHMSQGGHQHPRAVTQVGSRGDGSRVPLPEPHAGSRAPLLGSSCPPHAVPAGGHSPALPP